LISPFSIPLAFAFGESAASRKSFFNSKEE
jgi:hypothetical protein